MTWKTLIETDERWSTSLRIQPDRPRSQMLYAFLAHSGDSWYWLAVLAVIWMFAREPWRMRSAVMMISIVSLAAGVLALKFTIRRRRPDGDWGAVYRSTDPHSFPSGHAARASMLAVVALGLGPAWLGMILVLWAPLVSLARVVMGVHYVSDVVAGLILGILAGGIVLAVQPLLVSLLPFIF